MVQKYYGSNLFEEKTVKQIIDRINKLTPNTQRQWGKMTVDKMLAHCAETFEVANGHKSVKRGFLGYTLGPLLKPIFTNAIALGKNAPTSKEFKIIDSQDFEKEKERLKKLIQEFQVLGPEGITKKPHAFFGKLSSAQWARGMYKHTDHHLTQFGV